MNETLKDALDEDLHRSFDNPHAVMIALLIQMGRNQKEMLTLLKEISVNLKD